jgi:hypothetical protein
MTTKTTTATARPEKQIPCGDDNQKGKSKGTSRSPVGMTTKEEKAKEEADPLRG